MKRFFTVLGCTTFVAVTGWIGVSPAQSTAIAQPQILAQSTLQTYDGPQYNFPIRTQYPNTMEVDGGCGGEGCGFSFTFLPQTTGLDDAEVHIFLPRGAKSAAEQAVFVTGPNGLIENNGWAIAELGKTTQHIPSDWVKTVISFTTDDDEAGQIILGEVDGQAVQVMVIYPTALADQFWAAADVVLKNLTFATELLPLQPTPEGRFEGADPAALGDPRQDPG